MNPDKWEQIKGMVKDNFGIKNELREELEEGGGVKESVEFEGPMGLVRLDYIEKPRLLDKKTHYSRRIGGEVKVDYVYSDTEKVYEMNAYLWNDDQGDWTKIDAGKFDA